MKRLEDIKKVFSNVVSVHITRKDMNILTETEKQHITETALDYYNDYDYVINNDGSIEELKSKLSEI